MVAGERLVLRHGRMHYVGREAIGMGELLASEEVTSRRSVRLFLSDGQGDGFERTYGVGDEFLLGSQVWRVESIEGDYSDYRAVVVLVGSETELDEVDGWDYYLCDRGAGQVPVLAGSIVRVRSGGDLRQGFEAGFDGSWVASDWLYRVTELGEAGNPVPVTRPRMRALLTRWVGARRLLRLPDDVRPLGSSVSGRPWDYFLLDPDPAVGGSQGPVGAAADVAGEMLRHRPGDPYSVGWRLGQAGEWVPDDSLQRVWVEAPRRVAPISEVVASWLVAWWVRRGRFPKMPADVWDHPHWMFPPAGDWEYLAVQEREPGRRYRPGPLEGRPQGRIMARQVGASYRDGLVFTEDGGWVGTDVLFAAVVLEDPRTVVVQISEQDALAELTLRYGAKACLPRAVRPVVDRRGYVYVFDLAAPPPGLGLVRGFCLNGPDYLSAHDLDAALQAAGAWLDARWILAELESSPVGSWDPARWGLPTWDQFRRAAEWDERGFAGWPSWTHAQGELSAVLSSVDVDRLGQAYAFAARAHDGQTRPGGEPYTAHLLEVLQILAIGVGVGDVDQLTAGLLHDVVEDTATTLDQVRERFGSAVAEIVDSVTMPPSEPGDRDRVRAAYLERLRELPPAARIVKLADRYSNVQRLTEHPRPEKQASYFAETVQYVVPLAAQDIFFRPLFLAWQRRVGEALAQQR